MYETCVKFHVNTTIGFCLLVYMNFVRSQINEVFTVIKSELKISQLRNKCSNQLSYESLHLKLLLSKLCCPNVLGKLTFKPVTK